MATSRPAHVLGDVLREYEATTGPHAGQKVYRVILMSTTGKAYLDIPSQYVVVGDELDDLYPELEENDA